MSSNNTSGQVQLETEDWDKHFVTTWDTRRLNSPTVFFPALPSNEGHTLYDIDWDNDGVFDDVDIDDAIEHRYPQHGVYQIRVRGRIRGFQTKIIPPEYACSLSGVDQWGSIPWRTMDSMFDLEGCSPSSVIFNMPSDLPDLTHVENMTAMFRYGIAVPINLHEWDVSNVTDMSRMFEHFKGTIPLPIDTWNVGSVRSMSLMFAGASHFNVDISSWNVENVNDMRHMFEDARSFNQDLSSWNTKSLSDSSRMFKNAVLFNSNIDTWNTSNLRRAESMFEGARSFNGAIDGWDVSKLFDIKNIFNNAVRFNQDLSSWRLNVGRVNGMFNGATSFNKALPTWTQGIYSGSNFLNGTSFNQALGSLNLVTGGHLDVSHSDISIENWDLSISKWADESESRNVTIIAHGLSFCDSLEHRERLIEELGWSFVGDELSCP